MIFSRFIIISMLLVCTATNGYSADPSELVQAEFSELYGQFKAAIASRDPLAVATILAPKFQSEDTSGQVQNSDEMLARLATLPSDPNKKSKTTVVSVSVSGSTATVVQRYQMNTTMGVADGSVKPVELVAVSDDIWSRSGKSWKLLRTVTRQMDYSIDGKVVIHKSHVSH